MSLSKQMIAVKNFGGMVYHERNAAEAGIYPGMALKIDSSDDYALFDSEGGDGPLIVAIEDALQGHTVDDAYTIDYPVRAIQFRAGEEFHGLVPAGQDITIGEMLTRNSSGLFISNSDSGDKGDTVAQALEDEEIGSGSDNVLVRMVAV